MPLACETFGENEAMTDISHDDMERHWRLLNLEADTILKSRQGGTEVWKVVVAAMGAGAALITAGAAIGLLLAQHVIQVPL